MLISSDCPQRYKDTTNRMGIEYKLYQPNGIEDKLYEYVRA